MTRWMLNASMRAVILTLATSVLFMSPSVYADQYETVHLWL